MAREQPDFNSMTSSPVVSHGIQAKHKGVDLKLLIEVIGATGYKEFRYNEYVTWCEAHKIAKDEQLAVSTWPSWKSKHRHLIADSANAWEEAGNNLATFQKESRIRALENSYRNIRNDVAQIRSKPKLKIGDYSFILRAEEQMRKTLETIAKELGEYGVQKSGTVATAGEAVIEGVWELMNDYNDDDGKAEEVIEQTPV